MIVFDLKCTCGCQFEGWFASRADFDRQNEGNLIACPQCGSDEIRKILSPVALHCGTTPPEPTPPSAEHHEITPEIAMHFLRAVQDFVEQNFEDVGPKLAQESLKIHYGVAERRNIRGVTTEHEEKILRDEGIELLSLPMLKKPSDPKLN